MTGVKKKPIRKGKVKLGGGRVFRGGAEKRKPELKSSGSQDKGDDIGGC